MSDSVKEAMGGSSLTSASSPNRETTGQDSEPSTSTSSLHGKRTGRRIDNNPAKRGRRMFDILNSTLTKAKEDNVRRSSGEAGRKRAEIEARLQKKLHDEPAKQRKLDELGKRLKPLLTQMLQLKCKIESKESAIRLRKSQKRRLASFLITSSELSQFDGDIAKSTSIDSRILAPDVTLVLAPIGSEHPRSVMRPDSHPIYFLPKKTLPVQEDRLDEQEDRVDEEIEQADISWQEEKREMQAQIQRLTNEILELKLEMERLEGADTVEQQGDVEMKSTDK